MKKSIPSVVLIIISAVLAVAACFILPDMVVIQLSAGSAGNSTAPKLVAILIPTALGIGGAAANILSRDEEKSSEKSMLVSAPGIGLAVLMMIVNFFMK